MNVFVSYAREDAAVAHDIALAILGSKHEVFLDTHDLQPSDEYHAQIRDAINSADLMVWLISPDSVQAGSYTLSELNIAKARWRKPWGRVLPVMVRTTPLESVDPYLKAATILTPPGNPAADVALAVEHCAAVGTSDPRTFNLAGAVTGFVTLAATLLGGIASWFGLGSLPIDGRVAIAATASLLAAFPLSLVFNMVVREPRARWRKVWSAVAGFLFILSAGWLVWLSVTYHSLVIDDRCQPSQPEWRCFGLAAPRHPVNLEWRFGIDGRPDTIADWLPGFWSRTLGTSSTEFDDRSLTVRFNGFKADQYYGVRYLLKPADGGTVTEQISGLVPDTTSQIRQSQLQVLKYGLIAAGALLWPLASWFFYSSAPWWRRVNRPR